jgi:hypothetical protein
MDDLWVSRCAEIDPVILVLVQCFGTAARKVWYVWWFTSCFFYVHHPLFRDTLPQQLFISTF